MSTQGQKGMTLVEVLAALLLIGIIFGVGAMVMSQVGSFTETTSMRELDDVRADATMRVLRDELSQASEVHVLTGTELRYRQNFNYYALRFVSEGDGTFAVIRYDFYYTSTKSEDMTDEEIAAGQQAFEDTTITYALKPEHYANPRRIGERVIMADVYRPQDGDWAIVAPPWRIASGNIQLRMKFQERRNRAGTSETITRAGEVRTMTINLLNDKFG
jgi:prepilin-type N-terminal cleavage/methylation domain-containing protein